MSLRIFFPTRIRNIGKSCLLIIVMIFLSNGIRAQHMIGVGTRFDDSFREWIIATDDEDVEGEIRMRWVFQNDWTVWDIQLGNVSASIEQKWKDDPNLWEIRCGDAIVNAKTTWPGEFIQWKLSDGKNQYNWGTKYTNQRDEWLIDSRDKNLFKVYMYWEGDPREWVIEDNLPDDISVAMKMAMVFLAIHFSSPRV